MRHRTAAGLGSVVLLAGVALAGDVPGYKSPWEGYGVGSYVEMKTTSKTSGPGMPEMPGSVTWSRETVVKVTDEAHTIKRESRVAEAPWTASGEYPFPRKMKMPELPRGMDVPKAPDREDLGTEKVTVEGTAYECRKWRMKVDPSTTTTWEHEKHGLLKSETLTSVGGGKSTMTRTVTALAKKVSAAGKEFTCREWKTVNAMEMPGMPAGMGGAGTTSVDLESDEVPTRTVRSESSQAMGPMTTTTVRELTALVTK
jgi:hypothetical protein